MPEWTPDPVVPKFRPDPELLARAQRYMKAEEEHVSPRVVRARQLWEHAFGATRVALDSLRDLWPTEADLLAADVAEAAASALASIEDAYTSLDGMSEFLLGEMTHQVLQGVITTHEALDEMGVPR